MLAAPPWQIPILALSSVRLELGSMFRLLIDLEAAAAGKKAGAKSGQAFNLVIRDT